MNAKKVKKTNIEKNLEMPIGNWKIFFISKSYYVPDIYSFVI